MENKTKKEMDEVITELKKFTSRVSTKHDPVDPALIGRFESRFGLKLPEDYKYLLGITNGFSVMGNEVLGMTDESYSYDLFKVYQFEHYEVIVPQYEYHTRVKTNGGDSNQIVFWYSNYEYSESDPPEVTHQGLADFIKDWCINLPLESYDYNGDEKE